MHVIVMHSSPNDTGLTASCAQAAADAIRSAGHEAEEIRLKDYEVCSCKACNEGWGTCHSERRCSQNDQFPELHERSLTADGYVLVTPVYFGEPSEAMKAFADRLRRCERSMGSKPGGLNGKPAIAVAAAGGSGNGTITCLYALERWMDHVGARKFDFIGITRFTRPYKLEQIAQAARAMVTLK